MNNATTRNAITVNAVPALALMSVEDLRTTLEATRPINVIKRALASRRPVRVSDIVGAALAK